MWTCKDKPREVKSCSPLFQSSTHSTLQSENSYEFNPYEFNTYILYAYCVLDYPPGSGDTARKK